MNNSLETLENNRKGILFIELAGLLHDIGKLSKAFLEYRKPWQDDPQGWGKDPHSERKWKDQEANRDIEERYLDDIEKFKDAVPDEFKKEIKGITDCDFWGPDFSIQKAVHDHHKDDKDIGNITKMLKAADCKDAAIDRNNPLFSAEQKNTIYKSNVFGFETCRVVTYESQEKERKKLYASLRANLPTYFNKFDSKCRRKLLNDIGDTFEQGVSDTTRPQNDTSLWEHAYAVASILKVLSVHNLFNKEKEIYRFQDVKFGIFGVGWDGIKFISYGEKIGDITGRKNILEKVKESIKNIVEFKHPIGNTIYEDDDGIYFIVPVGFDKSYSTIRDALLNKIYETSAEKSDGELQPYTVDISETDTLTSMVSAIEEMRWKTSYRFDSSKGQFHYFRKFLQNFESGKTICPICRLRVVEKENSDPKICLVCKKRRIEASVRISDSPDQQTVFIDEIVDGNQGAALIVAQFGLREWLDGTMIRSLFVSEAKGIEKEIKLLGSIASFSVDAEKKLKSCFKDTQYNYSRIVEDIDSFSPNSNNKQRARNMAFLYTYGRKYLININNEKVDTIWEEWEKSLSAAKEEISVSIPEEIQRYNILNAKSPTPSTILDVWTTTLRFFTKEISKMLSVEFFPPTNRLKIKTKEDINPWPGPLKAELGYKSKKKKSVEILFIDPNHLEVIGERYTSNDLRLCDIVYVKITDKNYKNNPALFAVDKCKPGNLIASYRVITKTPNIYMAIVPANKALEVTKSIYNKYIEQFGKVMGRLPFSIGNIFFKRKMPMFVVLDSGKKMLNNFDQLNRNKKIAFHVERKEEKSANLFKLSTTLLKKKSSAYKRTIQWNLPGKLGNCEDDYYHSYFIVDSKNKNISTRPTFFKTIAGDVVHFKEIEEGDTLCVRPNFYDFEFLDSNIRRHKIRIDGALRRKSNIANFRSKPFLLDEVDQKLITVWKYLIQGKQLHGITDAKLRNLQSLWLTKYQEWSVKLDEPDSCKMWIKLVEASIKKEFPNIIEQDKIENVLLETIKNGVFFDMLELYLGILKMRVKNVHKKGD